MLVRMCLLCAHIWKGTAGLWRSRWGRKNGVKFQKQFFHLVVVQRRKTDRCTYLSFLHIRVNKWGQENICPVAYTHHDDTHNHPRGQKPVRGPGSQFTAVCPTSSRSASFHLQHRDGKKTERRERQWRRKEKSFYCFPWIQSTNTNKVQRKEIFISTGWDICKKNFFQRLKKICGFLTDTIYSDDKTVRTPLGFFMGCVYCHPLIIFSLCFLFYSTHLDAISPLWDKQRFFSFSCFFFFFLCPFLTTLQRLCSSTSAVQGRRLFFTVFHLLVLSPPICLHAPFAAIYVHVSVCGWLWLFFFFYWLCAKSTSHRRLMGLKYPLIALTSQFSGLDAICQSTSLFLEAQEMTHSDEKIHPETLVRAHSSDSYAV